MYKAGISLEQFGKLNMKQIHYIANAYAEKQKDEFIKSDVLAYVQGRYIMDALLATVGNMLGGKKANFSYPEQAYSLANKEELSEDEIQRQREQFIATLQTMGRNFELNKKKQAEQTQKGK